MDSRDHINQSLYEILEEILAKSKRAQKLNPPSPEKSELEETKSNEKSLKTLLKAKENLNDLKQKLMENPKKNKKELERLQRIESKLEVSIRKAERREIARALTALKKDPKRTVFRLVEAKDRLMILKTKLQENPRRYKAELQRMEKLEQRLNQKIENARSKTLRRAIMYIEKNPKRYKEELQRFSELEARLKQKLEEKRTQEKAKTKEKDLELIR
ncbi:hypothetical protein ABEV12_08315 [Geobacillus stearothermophilus]|uniref:hypothetical protein n=2 Tax=Geobacillus stearothermophilus TaxID=1422 RepID=UPI000518CF6E|nr:hypothetical protein [Geobacillus stearothermophilus]MED4332508.1 hypothetical protein [Geobacillus stearothermophilus]MED4995449.1 hypothetical protein [Geobacillus stearothermophilus]